MNFNWPPGYRERIENIVGAKYEPTGIVYFLGFEFNTNREAKTVINQIRLMQKQLRQLKKEASTQTKVLKSNRKPRSKKKRGLLQSFAITLADYPNSKQIHNYQNVILSIDRLIDACEKRKIEVEIWAEENKSKINNEHSINRQPISDDVQIFVWNRDAGKCIKCGRKENLEYDHIIPVSKGGSNTVRNLQLLCESCNREKGSKVGG